MAVESKIVLDKGFKEVNPVVCGYENCESGHFFGPAIRSHYLLHFVVSGKGLFRTKRGEMRLGAGDVFIIKPNEVTYYEADKSDPWKYYWLGFESSLPLPPAFDADYISAPALGEVFISAFDRPCKYSSGRGYEEHLVSSVYRIFSYMLSTVEDERLPESYADSAANIMDKEYSSGISVSDVAKRLHLSRTYFQELFRDRFGISPGRYLKRLRMQRAEEMIKEGGYSVSVVAASVGYSDVFVFSRAFKEYFSVSATEYSERYHRGSSGKSAL